jgi:guanylate kinase
VAVSATTRAKRPGEVDGVDYHFLTPEEFERRVRRGHFLEHVLYAGRRYGTLREEVERALAEDRSVVVEIELRGAREVRRVLSHAVSIFVAPPSLGELARRLEHRGTEDREELRERLAVGAWELQAMDEFDYRIVNEDVGTAIEELAGIIAAETAVEHDEPS